MYFFFKLSRAESNRPASIEFILLAIVQSEPIENEVPHLHSTIIPVIGKKLISNLFHSRNIVTGLPQPEQ